VAAREQRDRVSDEALARQTGRGWDEWFVLLDAWGGTGRTHAEIADYLRDRHGLNGWWAQGITVGYEQARDIRVAYQRTDGFTVNASKTIAVDADIVHQAFAEDRARRGWLPDAPMRLRTATAPKSARFDWGNVGRVNVTIIAKGSGTTSVQVEHARLESSEDVEPTREFWKDRLDDLKRRLERD
jgi:hypothetical protein